jgi:hypothetical protein
MIARLQMRISRFPDAQLRIRGLVLAHHPGMSAIVKIISAHPPTD